MRAYRKCSGEDIWIRSKEKDTQDYVFIEVYDNYVNGRAIASDVGIALEMLKNETLREQLRAKDLKDIELLDTYYRELYYTKPDYLLDEEFDLENP
jgi:hypothetical protein